MSRTMATALSIQPSQQQSIQLQHKQPNETSNWSLFYPRSRNEQYWAVRALSAETLLSAKVEHHLEIRDLTRHQDERRTVS